MKALAYCKMAFAGYGVELRPVTAWDLPSLRRWRNSPRIQRQMLDQSHIDPRRQRGWFESISDRNDQAHWVLWRNNVRTGHVNIRAEGPLNPQKSVSGGYYVADTLVRHPILGFSAVLMYHDIIFNHISAKNIEDTVLKTNLTARKMNQQMGYQEQGENDGVIKISLFPEDYRQAKQKLIRYFKDATCVQMS
jgi:RimJ/RimL family protein N-acetyltransferase